MDVSTFTRVQKKIHYLADLWNLSDDIEPDLAAEFEKDLDKMIEILSSCSSSQLVQSSDKPVNPLVKLGFFT